MSSDNPFPTFPPVEINWRSEDKLFGLHSASHLVTRLAPLGEEVQLVSGIEINLAEGIQEPGKIIAY